ncbi:MAG: serine protease [Candidatus Heimdallarchaeum endolithica]|uniref:Serine protease n=1 Tax=Candidatus Heimdallarchaeum endolithica TaxID=2876572 RepID=A0A9Y1FP92_9ARCH|nr:MAG: serine protease [Candidatus Heimdallarchaeum endolithica]
MTKAERLKLINDIESERDSKLLVYITGDRRGLETKIATDIFPIFHKHLMEIGHQNKIDLFLYSTGGITIAGYALVNLIREFCDEFNVIVPFKALSCATLIALGANEIVMTPMGQLSPVDPSIQHPLGPTFHPPGSPIQQITPVNVEDVNSFIDLAKSEFGLKKEDSLKTVFEKLVEKIHPLTLGAVQRSRMEISFLAEKLLKYHWSHQEKVDKVVQTLVRERFSHNYIISRREAEEELGLNIIKPEKEFTDKIINLFNQYSNILKLDTVYNPEALLGNSDKNIFTFYRGIIETNSLLHVYKTKKEVRRVISNHPNTFIPIIGYQEKIVEEGWFEETEI